MTKFGKLLSLNAGLPKLELFTLCHKSHTANAIFTKDVNIFTPNMKRA